LTISGSGGQGDPLQLETNAFQVVTSSTRPAGPTTGQSIYETDTKRYLVYDGTFWVIMAGSMPGCLAYVAAGSQAVLTAANTDINLPTERYDTDGFHASTNAFLTIPSGLAGDYYLSIGAHTSGNAVGQRTVSHGVTSNGALGNGALYRGSIFPSNSTANAWVNSSGTFRAVAGCVITISLYQDSGSTLTIPDAYLGLDMVRHIPSLV
jgi:hypothetical protein